MKKILMGSLVLTAFSLAILLFEMSSCKKATAQTTTVYDTVKVIVHDSIKYCPGSTYPVAGLYTGTYSVNSNFNIPGQFDYSFTIYPNGSFITRTAQTGGTIFASGKWALSGNNVFTATSTSFYGSQGSPVTQVFTANFSNSGVLTNGVWRDSINTNSTPLAGTFSTMQRVN